MLFQSQLTCTLKEFVMPEFWKAWVLVMCYSGCVDLGTSAEAAGVQEREDVEAEGSGQQACEVCSLQGELSAHTEAQEPELLHRTAQHQVLKHSLPLAVRPPVKLTRTRQTIMTFLWVYRALMLLTHQNKEPSLIIVLVCSQLTHLARRRLLSSKTWWRSYNSVTTVTRVSPRPARTLVWRFERKNTIIKLQKNCKMKPWSIFPHKTYI